MPSELRLHFGMADIALNNAMQAIPEKDISRIKRSINTAFTAVEDYPTYVGEDSYWNAYKTAASRAEADPGRHAHNSFPERVRTMNTALTAMEERANQAEV